MARRFIETTRVDSNNKPMKDNDYYFEKLVDDIIYDMKRERSSKKKACDWYYVFNQEQLEQIIKKVNKKFPLKWEINKEFDFIRIKRDED